ncbi:MAG: HDOD domain-containing protein [Pseudomonadota bacterium]|nr:HDOD domain-containing protein [Pseudomonadota bacterium]
MAQPLTDQQISDIMQGIRVPPQPQVLVDLQMEQMCPDPDPRSIAKLISQDVGLTGAILKVVNSAAYNLSAPSTSVEHAVNLIGIDSVINVINGLAIRSELSDATHYFRPENTSDDERKTLLGILKLAEHICGNYRILGQQDEDLEWQASGSEILAHLGLGEYDVEQLTLAYAESGVGAQNY